MADPPVSHRSFECQEPSPGRSSAQPRYVKSRRHLPPLTARHCCSAPLLRSPGAALRLRAGCSTMHEDSPLRTLLWLCIAVAAHVLTSLFAVLCRSLQVAFRHSTFLPLPFPCCLRGCCQHPSTTLVPSLLLCAAAPCAPMPALRLALLVNLLGLAVLLGGHGVALAGTWLLRHWARSQQRKLAEKASAQAAAVAAEGGQRQAAGHATLDAAATAAGGWPAMLPVAGSRMGAQTARPDSTQQLLAPAVVAHAGSEPPAAPHSATPQLQPPRPDVPLARGLSTRVRQLERRRPQLVRGAALAVLSGSYAVGAACQVAAAGLVDASVGGLEGLPAVCGAGSRLHAMSACKLAGGRRCSSCQLPSVPPAALQSNWCSPSRWSGWRWCSACCCAWRCRWRSTSVQPPCWPALP